MFRKAVSFQIAKDPARDPELRSVHADVLVPRCQKVRPGQYPFRVVIQERNIEPLLARVREVEIVNPSPGDIQHQIGVAVQQRRHRTGVLEGIHIDELPEACCH